MFNLTAHHRTFDAALRDLSHPKAQVRASAARDLGRFADDHRSQVVEQLTRTLERDDDADVRAAAAVALADAEAVEAVPALVAAANDEAHIHVRQMVLATLGELGDPRALPGLRAALRDEHPPIRFQATMAFARLCPDHQEAVQALVDATEDDDPLVCHIALRMAEEIGDESDPGAAAAGAMVHRARALLDHPADVVRVASAVILARSGSDAGNDVLKAVVEGQVQTTEGEDEAAAIELCGQRGLTSAAGALERRAFGRRLSFRRDPFVWHARVALAAMDHPRAVEWVRRELGSSSRERRTLAAAAAGRAGVTAARPELSALLRQSTGVDQEVVTDALAALDALGSDDADRLESSAKGGRDDSEPPSSPQPNAAKREGAE